MILTVSHLTPLSRGKLLTLIIFYAEERESDYNQQLNTKSYDQHEKLRTKKSVNKGIVDVVRTKTFRIAEMSELDKLQHLGLISKICAELDNHLGFSDKTLAEYIIHLGSQHKNNHKAFHKSLHDNGAEFPESFTENLLRIIMRLTGQAAMAKPKEIVNQAPTVPRSAAEVQFPGLARPNSNPIPLEDMASEQIISLVAEKEKPKEQPKEHSSKSASSSQPQLTKESERSRDSDRREGRDIKDRNEKRRDRSSSRDR